MHRAMQTLLLMIETPSIQIHTVSSSKEFVRLSVTGKYTWGNL